MPKVSDTLRSNLAYEFVAVAVVWAVVALGIGRAVVLWPSLTCVVAGALLKLQPSKRATWAWATASALLGLLVSGYQVYAAIPFVGGVFSTVAIETLVAFLAFALVHVMLFYTGYSPAGEK